MMAGSDCYQASAADQAAESPRKATTVAAYLRRRWMRAALALVLLPAASCALAPELFTDQFLINLGADPAAISQGTIILVFENLTEFPADMAASFLPDAQNIFSSSVLTVSLAPFGTSAVPDFCPIEEIRPGGNVVEESQNVADDAMDEDEGEDPDAEDTQAPAAIVFNDPENPMQGVGVPYVNTNLRLGDQYSCGDVIVIRVIQSLNVTEDMDPADGDGDDDGDDEDDSSFFIRVEIVPG